jgi:hypothetical protein
MKIGGTRCFPPPRGRHDWKPAKRPHNAPDVVIMGAAMDHSRADHHPRDVGCEKMCFGLTKLSTGTWIGAVKIPPGRSCQNNRLTRRAVLKDFRGKLGMRARDDRGSCIDRLGTPFPVSRSATRSACTSWDMAHTGWSDALNEATSRFPKSELLPKMTITRN